MERPSSKKTRCVYEQQRQLQFKGNIILSLDNLYVNTKKGAERTATASLILFFAIE